MKNTSRDAPRLVSGGKPPETLGQVGVGPLAWHSYYTAVV